MTLGSNPSTRRAEPQPVWEASTPVAIKNLHQSLSNEISLLRRSQGESLAVVLRPDSETRLLIRLSVVDGRLEAAARCERGDQASLQAHWPELRQALREQGVVLHDLQSAGGGLNDRSERGFARENDGRMTPGEAPRPGAGSRAARAPESATPLSGSPRLLESWA